MLIDDRRARAILQRIVCRLSADPAVREDLMQEALVHLWLLEARRPGQTESWYLQGCKFHLQNILGAGRSVDSPKRRAGKVQFNGEFDDFDSYLSGSDTDDDFYTQVSARDILEQLAGRLTDFERRVLDLLAEGLGAREIASRLRVTHPTVIKYRRRIANQAVRLGIDRAPTREAEPALA
jgi:DNA-directed RNA polymerase specialized sigma24 family protein